MMMIYHLFIFLSSKSERETKMKCKSAINKHLHLSNFFSFLVVVVLDETSKKKRKEMNTKKITINQTIN